MINRALLTVLILSLLALSIFSFHLNADRGSEEPENIIYISIDALTATHLNCYNYSRDTAPNICGLENSTIYENAYATSRFTPLSMAAMQRGVYAHRANMMNRKTPIDEDFYSTAELLREEGYLTVLKSPHSTVNRRLNFDEGFNQISINVSAEEMERWPSEFGDSLDNDRFYFRMHLIGPHDPYNPEYSHYNYTDFRFIERVNETISVLPRERMPAIVEGRQYNITKSQREEIIDHYDENTRAADKYVGEFIRELKRKGEYEESLIIITADHGESFNDYGNDVWLHRYVNPSVARVPLIIKYPGSRKSKVSSKLVSNMAPFKIILNEVGRELDYSLDAVDPRFEEKDRIFTYTKDQISVTNGTHLVAEKPYASYLKEDSGYKSINKSLTSLEKMAFRFKIDIRRPVYQTLSGRVLNPHFFQRKYLEDSENVRERLEKLGYVK